MAASSIAESSEDEEPSTHIKWKLWLVCQSGVNVVLGPTPGSSRRSITNDFIVGDVLVGSDTNGKHSNFVKLRVKSRTGQKQWIRKKNKRSLLYQVAEIPRAHRSPTSYYHDEADVLPPFSSPLTYFKNLASTLISWCDACDDSDISSELRSFILSPMFFVTLEYLPLTCPLFSVKSTLFRGFTLWSMYSEPYCHLSAEAVEFLRRVDLHHRYLDHRGRDDEEGDGAEWLLRQDAEFEKMFAVLRSSDYRGGGADDRYLLSSFEAPPGDSRESFSGLKTPSPRTSPRTSPKLKDHVSDSLRILRADDDGHMVGDGVYDGKVHEFDYDGLPLFVAETPGKSNPATPSYFQSSYTTDTGTPVGRPGLRAGDSSGRSFVTRYTSRPGFSFIDSNSSTTDDHPIPDRTSLSFSTFGSSGKTTSGSSLLTPIASDDGPDIIAFEAGDVDASGVELREVTSVDEEAPDGGIGIGAGKGSYVSTVLLPSLGGSASDHPVFQDGVKQPSEEEMEKMKDSWLRRHGVRSAAAKGTASTSAVDSASTGRLPVLRPDVSLGDEPDTCFVVLESPVQSEDDSLQSGFSIDPDEYDARWFSDTGLSDGSDSVGSDGSRSRLPTFSAVTSKPARFRSPVLEARSPELTLKTSSKMKKKKKFDADFPSIPRWVEDIYASARCRENVYFALRLYLVDARLTAGRILAPHENLDVLHLLEKKPSVSSAESMGLPDAGDESDGTPSTIGSGDVHSFFSQASSMGIHLIDRRSEETDSEREPLGRFDSDTITEFGSDVEMQSRASAVKAADVRGFFSASQSALMRSKSLDDDEELEKHSGVHLMFVRKSTRLRHLLKLNKATKGSQWFRSSFRRRHLVAPIETAREMLGTDWKHIDVLVGGNFGAGRSRHYVSLLDDKQKPLNNVLPILTFNAVVSGSAKLLSAAILKDVTV